MAAPLTGHDPAERLENPHHFLPTSEPEVKPLCCDLDLPRLNRQRQSFFRADFKTERNGLFDILQSLFFCLALANAAGNRRALDNP
jgi:hypothetical protein